MKTKLMVLASFVAVACLMNVAPLQADDKQAREVLDKHLDKYPAAKGGQVIAVTDEPVAKAFPKDKFFVLRFRQFPIAREVPAPLKNNNLFIVRADDKVELITDAKGLEKFFAGTLAKVEKAEDAKTATSAWLRLAQEFHQDGFYKFTLDSEMPVTMTKDLPPSNIEVKGTAKVDPQGGNKGQIVATLVFEKGKLAKVTEDAKLIPGPRPICQATKLLDPDPIVRAMAEQTILIMGKNCKSYLDEQRVKAGPELQKAIDRIWQQILDEDR